MTIIAAALLLTAAPDQHHNSHPAPAPQPGPARAAQPASQDHAGHDGPEGGQQDHADHRDGQAEHGSHPMTGTYGPYPATREASGTAWQPDTSHHGGLHLQAGGWTLMAHALLNGVMSLQEGPRGDEKVFVSGMVMGAARRPLGPGTLQFRAMLSPDPFMGRDGYPLLLASGETADGVNPLVDRQHPHDFFMELSASYSLPLDPDSSLFVYGGLPGEPAFGPPAFMHRMSIMDSPEAPVTHHWLDSTHIVFGVVTAGITHGGLKLEASRFNGREPDEERYDIETGPLDSTAVRIAWNPTRELSLQASWADLKSPEQLHPEEDEERWSTSLIYTRPIGTDAWWSSTIAWGRRSGDHDDLDALVAESAFGLGRWTLFGRAEYAENNELERHGGHHGEAYGVGKVSLGALHDFTLARNVRLGLGGLYAFNFLPEELEEDYGGEPGGAMLFVRLKIN